MRGCACVGSLSTVDPQVVQPGTGEHDLVAEGAAKAAASVFDDAAALNPADGMLHDDTLLADPAVKALLYLGQQGLGWLFYGQQGERALQPIALEAPRSMRKTLPAGKRQASSTASRLLRTHPS